MGTTTAQIQLTDAELKLLQTLVYQECGMFFDERRSHFLKDRLLRRLKACQLDSFYNYYRLLTSREGKNELALLLENLTVNETSFFRNRPQLDLLQKSVLEEILRKKQERRDWNLRVWSAGCSSGQEAFSVAILICDALAYYYLRNPLPFEMPSPKPLIPPPWKPPTTIALRLFCGSKRRTYCAISASRPGPGRSWRRFMVRQRRFSSCPLPRNRCGCSLPTGPLPRWRSRPMPPRP